VNSTGIRSQLGTCASLAYSDFLAVEQIGFGVHHLACGCPVEPADRFSRNLVSALYHWKALQSCVYLSAVLNLQ